MYYIHTADPLQRTSVWLEKLEGGLEQVKQVIIEDSLEICETLEADMARLVHTYHCEWAEVVKNPEKRALFRHFANAEAPDSAVAFVPERGQKRPADWPDGPFQNGNASTDAAAWWKAGRVETFPRDGGMAVDYAGVQLAVFHVAATDRWYASQNMCPHKQDMLLARGMVGEKNGVAKVACPLHKKQFSLEDGSCLSGDGLHVATFDVKVADGFVYLLLPPAEVLMKSAMPETACAEAC
jgi:nitrite reductase (NADH) large subunit